MRLELFQHLIRDEKILSQTLLFVKILVEHFSKQLLGRCIWNNACAFQHPGLSGWFAKQLNVFVRRVDGVKVIVPKQIKTILKTTLQSFFLEKRRCKTRSSKKEEKNKQTKMTEETNNSNTSITFFLHARYWTAWQKHHLTKKFSLNYF